MRLLKIIIGTIVLFFVCAAISITLSIPLVVFAISGSILAIYINCKITLKEQRIRRVKFYLKYKSRKPYPAWNKETEGFRSARAICIGLYIRDCVAKRIGLPSALIYPQDIISHIVNDFGEFRGNLYFALNDINRIVGYGELCYLKTFQEENIYQRKPLMISNLLVLNGFFHALPPATTSQTLGRTVPQGGKSHSR